MLKYFFTGILGVTFAVIVRSLNLFGSDLRQFRTIFICLPFVIIIAILLAYMVARHTALIQTKVIGLDLEKRKIRTLYWLNIAFGGPLLVGIVFAWMLKVSDGWAILFFGVQVGAIVIVLFFVGTVLAAVNALSICSSKVIFGIFSLLLIIQFGLLASFETGINNLSIMQENSEKIYDRNVRSTSDTNDKLLNL